MINQDIALGYQSQIHQVEAQRIATELNLKVNQNALWQLYLGNQGLGLKYKCFNPYYPDFNWNTWKNKVTQGKNQALVKACLPKKNIEIVDVTAGWGRDAAILASFGAKVIMIERNPILAFLLEYALNNRSQESKDKLQLNLYHSDAIDFLNQQKTPCKLIYMDPMHPPRRKKALVKKEMQLLQNFIGSDTDAITLLKTSIEKSQKVVVKWPSSELPLLPCKDSLIGKTVRFDRFYSHFCNQV